MPTLEPSRFLVHKGLFKKKTKYEKQTVHGLQHLKYLLLNFYRRVCKPLLWSIVSYLWRTALPLSPSIKSLPLGVRVCCWIEPIDNWCSLDSPLVDLNFQLHFPFCPLYLLIQNPNLPPGSHGKAGSQIARRMLWAAVSFSVVSSIHMLPYTS